MAEFEPPERIYGVDFSAAKRDAGRNTWIAECTPTDEGLEVECLADAATRLECDPDRGSTLDALVDEIAESPGDSRAFGLDFPFCLPVWLLDGDDWHEFVSETPDRWGALGAVDGPRSLYDSAEERAQTGGGSLRRETDEAHGGQKPTGFRIKTQTYYGISELLAAVAEEVSVVPMDAPEEDTLLLETYPASVFRRLEEQLSDEVYDIGYKRDTREAIERRRANVEALQDSGVEFGDHRDFAVGSDHALDAVAAAYATWQATNSGDPGELVTNDDADRHEVEGYIFC